MPTYAEQLNATKAGYPFDRWREFYQQDGPDAVAECNAVEQLFDQLIAGLITLGADATEEAKMQLFQTAIEGSNDHADIIETGEREDLCDLTWNITKATGLNPADYGDGEGPASEWREW